MTRWRELALGEACELYQPQTIATAQLVNDGPYEVFGANGVIGRYHRYNHEEPQLLVTCRGATCGTVNKSSPKSWINGNAMVVRPKSNDIDLSYLEHLLRGGVDLSIAITGAAQPQITRQSLAPIKAKFPPLPEQRRIAAILDQADALRAKRRESLAELDKLTQSIFLEMFGDPASNPMGWPLSTLGDLINSASDGPHVSPTYAENGVPFLSARHVRPGQISWHDLKYLTQADAEVQWKKCKPSRGDILYTKGGTTGFAAVVETDEEFAVWVHIALLKPNHQLVDSAWLEAMLNTQYCYRQSQDLTNKVRSREERAAI